MIENNLTVTDGLVVNLDYTLRLDDGKVIDTSAGCEPLNFVQGQGQIVPGLEREIYGMAVGDERDVVVAPADGYGDRDPDKFLEVSRDGFPSEMNLEQEVAIRMRDTSGQVTVAFVADVRPDVVLLDLNHPLAGQTLHFHVKVSNLQKPTKADSIPD